MILEAVPEGGIEQGDIAIGPPPHIPSTCVYILPFLLQ